MQKELAKLKINNKIDKVINKWKLVIKKEDNYRKAFSKFINTFGNLGEAQLVRLVANRGSLNRDLAITCEPKEDNLNEYNLVLRSILYDNKTNDGLHTNKIGTVVYGRYELDEFDKLWDDITFRNRMKNKVKD